MRGSREQYLGYIAPPPNRGAEGAEWGIMSGVHSQADYGVWERCQLPQQGGGGNAF